MVHIYFAHLNIGKKYGLVIYVFMDFEGYIIMMIAEIIILMTLINIMVHVFK